jgi:predicted ribosomally synthesized peptide with SipW-like signal peptide
MRIRIELVSRDGHALHRREAGGGRMQRALVTLLVVGLLGLVTGAGSFSAFTATTSNSGNSFAAGSVAIQDDDSATAMLSLSNAKPGDSDTSCIKVTYTGSLDAGVRLYAATSGSLPQYLNVTITRGTNSAPSFDSCAGFTPDATNYNGDGAGVIYNGTLASLPSTWAAGIVDPKAATPRTWTTNEAHSYKFVVTLADDNNAQTLNGGATFTWEARNQ